MNRNESNITLTIIWALFLIISLPVISVFLGMVGIQTLSWHVWLVVAVIILIWWCIATYNSFVNLQQKIKQASGSIDVYLKQRFDLIPNLVETVKGYAKYEKEVLSAITKLRTDYDNRNQNDIKESQVLNERYSNILALVEGYPELKASESFLNLQKVLSKLESQLQAARRIYNMEVTEYNMKRLKIPSNLIAALFGFKEADLFEVTEVERENVSTTI